MSAVRLAETGLYDVQDLLTGTVEGHIFRVHVRKAWQ
jgi:hypothetical protein